jgi:hypothetical protein
VRIRCEGTSEGDGNLPGIVQLSFPYVQLEDVIVDRALLVFRKTGARKDRLLASIDVGEKLWRPS